MASTVSLDAVLSRLNELIHEFNLMSFRLDELEKRFESVPKLVELLAKHEDIIRRQDSGEEDLVG